MRLTISFSNYTDVYKTLQKSNTKLLKSVFTNEPYVVIGSIDYGEYISTMDNAAQHKATSEAFY